MAQHNATSNPAYICYNYIWQGGLAMAACPGQWRMGTGTSYKSKPYVCAASSTRTIIHQSHSIPFLDSYFIIFSCFVIPFNYNKLSILR